MIDLAIQWLSATVDVSVKAAVLAFVALLGLRLLKVRDSNLRHRTWTGALPVALGVIRTRVLLPSDWCDWSTEKLQAVIAHELTHIQRRDGAVIFLAELNRCLYWFHPVAWWLRNQLGQLAESACDDAAIDFTGDRTSYARHLLEVAASVSGHQGRLTNIGLSMARPSNVETRIDAILDFTRPLSKRLTTKNTLLLCCVLVPLIAVAAAVQPMANVNAQSPSENTESDSALATESNQNASPTTDANDDDSKSTLTYSGRVETPQGNPISGAKIWLAVTSYEFNSEANRENRKGLLRPLGTSDSEGRFEVMLDAATIKEINRRRNFAKTKLLATAQGRGLDAFGCV